MEGLHVNKFIKSHVEELKDLCSGVTDNAVFYKQVKNGEDNIELEEEIKFPPHKDLKEVKD